MTNTTNTTYISIRLSSDVLFMYKQRAHLYHCPILEDLMLAHLEIDNKEDYKLLGFYEGVDEDGVLIKSEDHLLFSNYDYEGDEVTEYKF